MTDRGDGAGRERRIRERAYFLWLAAGRPEGQALLHWRQAEAIEDAGGRDDFQADEASRGAGPAGEARQSAPRPRPPRPSPLPENYGCG